MTTQQTLDRSVTLAPISIVLSRCPAIGHVACFIAIDSQTTNFYTSKAQRAGLCDVFLCISITFHMDLIGAFFIVQSE
jgi:hypothetical protein